MASIDVFNGDADGICALIQLRLASPVTSALVTGVKRDIELLDRVVATAGDFVTVLDVSLDKNRSGLERILASGAHVLYVDHHFAGELPVSGQLECQINEAPDVCTSLLVNGRMRGRFAKWAVVGACGDNLTASAERIAASCGVQDREFELLRNLGICINYNGYGEKIEDLFVHPADLFRAACGFDDPGDFLSSAPELFRTLEAGYHSDLGRARAVRPEFETAGGAVLVLPDEAWARRVGGVFGNDLANERPDRAHAVLSRKASGSYLVSVRAPLSRKTGADVLCRRFPTGGGRAAAAGINDLPAERLGEFIENFGFQFQQ